MDCQNTAYGSAQNANIVGSSSGNEGQTEHERLKVVSSVQTTSEKPPFSFVEYNRAQKQRKPKSSKPAQQGQKKTD